MKHFKNSRYFFFGSLLFLMGYFSAILLFKKTEYINNFSGLVRTEYQIFPFRFCEKHHDRAFPAMFGYGEKNSDSWSYIYEKGFFHSSQGSSYGSQLLLSQSYLVSAVQNSSEPYDYWWKIGRDYFSILKEQNISNIVSFASNYKNNTDENNLRRIEESIKQNQSEKENLQSLDD